MKRKLFVVLLLIILSTRTIYANSTSYKTTTHWGATNQWVDAANAAVSDNNYAYAIGSSVHLRLYNFGFNIPLNATIDSITWAIEGKASGSGGSPDVRSVAFTLYKEDNDTFFGSVLASCQQLAVPVGSLQYVPGDSEATTTKTALASCWPNHTITPQDINDSNFGVKLTTNTNASPTYYIDQLQLLINYTITGEGFSMVIDNSTASESAGFISMDLSGTTGSVAANMRCQFSLFEQCTDPNGNRAGWHSTTPVAHIDLYGGSSSTQTLDNGGGYYTGHGWGPPQTTWQAENVHVPYNAGFSCSYPISYFCSDVNTRELLYEGGYDDDNRLIATPSAQAVDSEPEPNPLTNPFEWLGWKIKNIFSDLFYVPPHVNDQMFNDLKTLAYSKRPFFIIPVFEAMDFGEAFGSPSAMPEITLGFTPKLKQGAVWTDLTPINFVVTSSDTAPFQTYITFFRNFFSVIILLSGVGATVVIIKDFYL